MFSLCRLCAKSIETTDPSTEISELKIKLEMCCGWKSSQNEVEMPQVACKWCVDQLQTSWSFAESVLAAQIKLVKLLNEAHHMEEVQDTSTVDQISIENLKTEPDIECDEEYDGHFCDVTAFVGPIMESDAEDSLSNKRHQSDAEDSLSNKRHRKRKKSTKTLAVKETSNPDTFLDTLTNEDRLAGGLISANGVDKLTKLFPEMTQMSWNDCQYKCQKCNQIIKSPQNFFAHNRSIHLQEIPSMKFSCFYCNFKHSREQYLNKHIVDTHFPHLKYRCFYCPDFFWDVHKLIKHRNMHIDVEYKCEICEHIFWNREILYSHVAQSHFKKRWGVTEGKFTCDICNKDFATKWSITSHMLQHTKKFDFVCDQCGWKFLTKGNLKGHLQTKHMNERPFPCKQCDKSFKTKYQLSTHSKRHEQFKPLACTVCEKRFREMHSLTVHMRSHNNICPYQCKYCDRKFRHTSSLKTHERTHTSEKPYICCHCDYKSTNWPNLNKHSIRIHSVDLRVKKGLKPDD